MVIRRLRAFVYKRGYRPKPGNPLYSPSLDIVYSVPERFQNLNFGPIVPYYPPEIAPTLKKSTHDSDSAFDFSLTSLGTRFDEAAVAELKKSMARVSRQMMEASRGIAASLTPMFTAFWEKSMKDPEVRLAYWTDVMMDRSSDNPWPIGTDAWHEYNLHGRSIGHIKSIGDTFVHLSVDAMIYKPTDFLYDAEKVLESVRTAYPGQKHLYWIPEELS
jgi:hypothetical protein